MENFNAYKKVFNQSIHLSVTKAVDYLIKNHIAKTQTIIAKKTNISLSTLTGYMNGKKQVSKNFITTFEEVFGLNLLNPVSFEQDPVFDNLSISNLPNVSGVTYLIAQRTFRKQIRAQQMIIEGLKKTNEGLIAANEELYNYILIQQS